MINQQIFRAYDIRGNSKSDLSIELAYKIGYCFGKKAITQKNNLMCVGMDGRISSPDLCLGLITGLKDAKAKVKFFGIIPTPALYYADKIFSPAGSIMVTGSHNPKDDNGFKMLMRSLPFFGNMIQELQNLINLQTWHILPLSSSISNIEQLDIKEEYVTRLLQNTKINPNLKIIFDPANGAAAEVTTLLCKKLPCQTHVLNEKIDGSFPAHPADPTVPKNLEQLKKYVIENQYNLGIGFDGDGDRIGVVTASGNILFGDQLLCLYAKKIITEKPGATIIADVKASGIFFDYVKKLGGNAIMWKTGHAFIKAKIQESKAELAGEMSGHIFFAHDYYGYDDALYAAIKLIDILSSSILSLDEMINELPKAYNTPEIRLTTNDKTKFQIINKIKAKAKKNKLNFQDIDGLRVSTKHGWWLLRASNTQPAIIARCESSTIEGLEILKHDLNKILLEYGLKL